MGEQETTHELNFPVQFDSAWQGDKVCEELQSMNLQDSCSCSIPPQISLLGVKFWKAVGRRQLSSGWKTT